VRTMPTAPLPDNAATIMAQAMRQSIPELKTQVQFNAFMAGFDSFKLLCNSIFAGNASLEDQARAAFEKSLEAMKVATRLSNQFQEIPAEERGPSATQFVEAPLQFGEYDLQRRLLTELDRITTIVALNKWYQGTKEDREKILSQSLRNILFDAIRSKRDELSIAQQ
jgi:hypothetical protein